MCRHIVRINASQPETLFLQPQIPEVSKALQSESAMQTQIHEVIIEYLFQAQSESHDIQHKALHTLSYLTKVSPHNRNILAQTEDALPILLSLSKSSSTQTLSLSVLFNLSLNPNLRQTLAKMDTIQLLNTIILSPSSPDNGKSAASLICSLAMLDKNKARFGVAGTVQTMVRALDCASTSRSYGARHYLLSSLAELLQFHGNCTLAVRAGAVTALFQVVECTDGEDVAGSALSILGLLARFEEGIKALRAKEGIVCLLVDVLKRRCMFSKEGSAELLLKLFEKSEELMREAVELPEFSSLVADLSVRGSSMAREKAGMLMMKMMEANLNCYVEEGNPIFLQW